MMIEFVPSIDRQMSFRFLGQTEGAAPFHISDEPEIAAVNLLLSNVAQEE